MIGFTQGSSSTFSQDLLSTKTFASRRHQLSSAQLQLQALYRHLPFSASSPSAPRRLEPPLPGLQETAPDEGVDHICLARTFTNSIQGFMIPPGPCVSGRIVTEPLASTGAIMMVRCQPGAVESHPNWPLAVKTNAKRDKGQRSGKWKYWGVI